MQVSNTTYYDNLDFEKYLDMPGTSYSSLKENHFPDGPSAGMQLGTRVHNYLLEPDKYDWKDTGVVKKMAEQIRKFLGDALSVLDKEMAFTADFTHNGMVMPYKGRADLMKAGRVIVDLKILASGVDAAIERFGYKKQVSGYCLATGASVGLIVAYNKYKHLVEVRSIKPDAAFWEYQVVRLGVPIKERVSA